MRLQSILLLAMMTTGCATMTRGTRQEVRIDTQPQGARVLVNGEQYTSPVTLSLKRKQAYSVHIMAPGYKEVAFELKAKWDGLSLLSFALPLGSVWTLLDFTDGADRSFAKVEPIVMQTQSYPDSIIRLKEYKGKMITEERYAQATEAEVENDTQSRPSITRAR